MNDEMCQSKENVNCYKFPLGVTASLFRDAKALLDDINLKLGWFTATEGEVGVHPTMTAARSSPLPAIDVPSIGVGDGLEVWPDGFCFSHRSRSSDCRMILKGLNTFSFSIQYHESHGILRDTYDMDYLAQMLMLQCLERVYWTKDSALIHGGSVSRNGRAVLLVGRGGSRKTSIILDLVRRHGCTFMGDDRSLLCGPDVHPFPLSSEFAAFSLRNLDNEDVGFVDKMRFLLGRPWGLGRADGFTGEKARLAAVVFLENTARATGDCLIRMTDGHEHDKLSANSELEEMECSKSVGIDDGIVWRAFTAYASRYPDSMESRYRAGRLAQGVCSTVIGVPRYRLQTSRGSLDAQCRSVLTVLDGL